MISCSLYEFLLLFFNEIFEIETNSYLIIRILLILFTWIIIKYFWMFLKIKIIRFPRLKFHASFSTLIICCIFSFFFWSEIVFLKYMVFITLDKIKDSFSRRYFNLEKFNYISYKEGININLSVLKILNQIKTFLILRFWKMFNYIFCQIIKKQTHFNIG